MRINGESLEIETTEAIIEITKWSDKSMEIDIFDKFDGTSTSIKLNKDDAESVAQFIADLNTCDDREEIIKKAMEDATKVLGADPAYFGKEGDEEVERQLLKMGYSPLHFKDN